MRKALLIGLLSFFAASRALAGAEPVVCWSADAVPNCGCSSATPTVIPDGSNTFHLYLETGSAVSTGTVCEFSSTDPSGDEVCAVALGLESTDADLAIDGFAAAASGAVSNLIAATNLVINYFDPLGTRGCLVLGSVDVTYTPPVSPTSPLPQIQLTATTSEWTNAALGTEIFPATPLPEPSLSVALMLGALLSLARAKSRSLRRSCAPVATALFATLPRETLHRTMVIHLPPDLLRVERGTPIGEVGGVRLPDTDDMREESARMLVKFEDAGGRSAVESLRECLRATVRKSSLRQLLAGVLATSPSKSARYAASKLFKSAASRARCCF